MLLNHWSDNVEPNSKERSKYALLCYWAVQYQINYLFFIGQCRTNCRLYSGRMAVPTRSSYVLSKYGCTVALNKSHVQQMLTRQAWPSLT